MSLPKNCTRPLHARVSPISVRSVVVLPMPLRPISETTSRSPTASVIPRRICFLPYPDVRRETDSIASAIFIEPILCDLSSDEEALDLARALVDLKDSGIPVEPLDRMILHVAISPEDLQSLRADTLAHLGSECLGHGGGGRIGYAGILAPRRISSASRRPALMLMAMSASLKAIAWCSTSFWS